MVEHAMMVSALVPMIMTPIVVATLSLVNYQSTLLFFPFISPINVLVILIELWLVPDESDKIDGNWGDWSDWSNCPVSCGGSTQTKSRLCNNPKPENGGKNCSTEISSDFETQRCNETPCPGW